MDEREQARFERLIGSWRAAADDVIGVLHTLAEDEWALASDLPGWTVHDIAAHLAHLEATLAGAPQDEVEVPDLPHVHGPIGRYTEAGVIARRNRTGEELITELAEAIPVRAQWLADHPPSSLANPGDSFAQIPGWDYQTLLNNRPIDLWMHEQDIRRAIGRPGGLESAGAEHTKHNMTAALGYVLARRARAEAGQTLVLQATGPGAIQLAFEMGVDKRCRPLNDPPAEPTTTLTMTFEEWMRRCGGRGGEGEVTITGDQDLGHRVLRHLAVTP